MKALKEYIKEGILDTTRSGRKEYIESYLEKTFPGMTRSVDFEYDEKTDRVQLWNLPKSTQIEMDKWDESVKFSLFEPFSENILISISGNNEYKKFLNCFDCAIGDTNSNKGKNKIKIVFCNCAVKGSDFKHKIYGKVVIDGCHLTLQDGPNATEIVVHKNCIIELMPYGFENLKFLEIQK